MLTETHLLSLLVLLVGSGVYRFSLVGFFKGDSSYPSSLLSTKTSIKVPPIFLNFAKCFNATLLKSLGAENRIQLKLDRCQDYSL